MSECVVVIPFFQRAPGVLGRSLASVFGQTYQDFSVIVIDDASPVSAASELDALPPAWRDRVSVMRQDNRGPGGARNTALDRLPAGADFVAFLDSDDEWTTGHLERCIGWMKAEGAQCCWETMSAEAEFDPYLPPSEFSRPDLLDPVPDEPGLYRISHLSRFLMHKWWHFLHLSATVVSRPIFENVRFDESYRIAGEDFMFFYACAQFAKVCLVSDRIGASRGKGSNIYHGTEFATRKAVEQMYLSIRALGHVKRSRAFHVDDSRALRSWQEETREHAIRNMVSGLFRRRIDIAPVVGQWLVEDPKLAVTFLRMAVRLSFKGRNVDLGPAAARSQLPDGDK